MARCTLKSRGERGHVAREATTGRHQLLGYMGRQSSHTEGILVTSAYDEGIVHTMRRRHGKEELCGVWHPRRRPQRSCQEERFDILLVQSEDMCSETVLKSANAAIYLNVMATVCMTQQEY
jgi:hypothetical protein